MLVPLTIHNLQSLVPNTSISARLRSIFRSDFELYVIICSAFTVVFTVAFKFSQSYSICSSDSRILLLGFLMQRVTRRDGHEDLKFSS
jgi:hypothetical protein